MASATTVFCSLLLIINILNSTAESNFPDDNLVQTKFYGETFYTKSYIPKSDRLTTPQMIQYCGHEYEEFDVTTEDKYILKLFHIKGNRSEDPPILLNHGVMDSSDTYLIRGKKSLAINLTESGYDVWLGNFRGNKYSRHHLVYDPDVNDDFWDYSFHENGYYDIPAMIDCVLRETGKSQLIIVGHSQGTANQFVAGATRPEYNDKIKVFIALAPIYFMNDFKGIDTLAKITTPTASEGVAIGKLNIELFDPNSTQTRFLQDACTKYKSTGSTLCREVFFLLFGSDPEGFEPEFVPVVMGHYFAGGTTVKSIVHASQFFHDSFHWFDYGPTQNMVRYNSIVPPLYKVSKFTSQIVLMVGSNDLVGDTGDCKDLWTVLPNVEYFQMPRETFSHVDFVWGRFMEVNFFPYFHHFLNKYK